MFKDKRLMSGAYVNRLIAINEMLASPYPPTVEEGLSMLRDLLEQNCDDPGFLQEVQDMLPHSSAVRLNVLNMIEQHQKRGNPPAQEPPSPVGVEVKKVPASPAKIFISYSHKDERYKNDLVTILLPLQNQGIIEIWQDRRIEEGNEWYQAIRDAMNNCNVALLLVSKHFLASDFILREELPKLLQMRKEQGLRVIPIIISECLWQSIPVLKDLQAYPRDGKALLSLRGSGQRDKAWTELTKVIERLSREQ
jgi:hypothetical protein